MPVASEDTQREGPSVVLASGGQLVLARRPLWGGRLLVMIAQVSMPSRYGFSRLTHAVGRVWMCVLTSVWALVP